MIDIKDYWRNQEALQKELSEYMVDHVDTLTNYSKKIGIHVPTLVSFLRGKKIDFSTWCKIYRFITK